MIQTGFETRVKVQQIIENQLPEFVLDESPNAVDFLKQYYISQEYQGGPVDIAENLDQYLKLDNLSPEVVVGNVGLSTNITSTVGVITVTSTKGFPQKYGLFKINDEIITYTGITTNTFTGCIRGFSGITTYHTISNPQELGFSTSKAASHTKGSSVQNLSSLFLKEFYKKLKYSLTPGLEDVDFVSDLNLGNFIKEARSFYQAKGTDESFRILFNVLYGVKPKVVNLENLIIKPSAAEYIRREIVVAEAISGNPTKLVGQSIRKSSDTNTYASVSEVEAFTKNNKTYYQISLFIGYNESSDIQGTFNVQGKSLVIENVSVGSSVITVDSTIGFAKTGNLISGDNIISYTDKSINQFFGCSGIKNIISVTNSIRTDEVIYGYENGDLSKKVELRFTGVISKFVPLSEVFITEEGEELYVKNLGEIIKNPSIDKSYKEIFANSWIYNTSSRYQIDSISGSSLKLKSLIDKSSLKVGDSVEILLRDTEILKSSPTNIAYILNINTTTNQIDLANLTGFVYDLNLEYDIRRKLNKAKSSGSQLQFGNNILISDIQNVYNENDEYMYVASNSLPSYTITKNLFEVSIPEATPPKIQGFDNLTQKYSIISFSSNVPFITGDEIYYSAEYVEIPGLTEGVYYVEVIAQNQIRLYLSRSFINSNYDSLSTSRPYIQFDVLDSNSGSHYFTLNSQKNRSISPSKILKKFPLSPNLANGSKELTQPGSVGMLIDGVEIINYKSNDKIYYGPLDSVEVLNGGNGYDVINLPQISITSDIGSDATIQPVIRGSLQKVFVDPQDFDINSIVSIALTGGNGSGASFDPVIVKRIRELSFDARESTNSGGLDINNETITFTTNHNLRSGDPISYDSNGNLPIGIGTYGGSNSNPAVTLSGGSFYYCSVVNSNTIQLYKNISDYNSGINTIGFTTESTVGIHKFRTEYNKSTLKEIKIINPGSGYENRKLIINPTGISTIYDSINFTNHGFKDGDLIVYNYQNQSISGLSTSIQYRVLKITDDSFRLCNAGSAGTITSYYQRQDYIKLQSSGSGYQYFSYPQISLSVKYTAVGLGTTTQTVGIITATPIIRGEIVGAYLYERGVDYGSTILNLHKKPSIVVKNGKNAQISPIIVGGSVQNVFVQYGGSEYYSIPDLVVKGDGTGASLRPIILNGRIDSVIVVNPGVGYAQSTTSISIIPAGSNAIFNSNVRSLTVNTNRKYGDQVISQSGDNLEYFVSGYESTVRSNFNDPDPTTKHSPIIGWAYDGNPIYGPYGYSDPQDSASIKVLKSGYELNTSNIVNRPSGFDAGFFVEDYTYTNCGDLDENNGRFGKTKDFPNGIYAYFATVSSTNVGITSFPYFIGNSYRSNYINDNLIINQSFDFNRYNLIRNTLPYKVNDVYAGNDFIIESNNLAQQKSIVESVTKSSIEEIDIINSGYNYKINDILEFDNTGTGGGGLNAIISSITGSEISAINTNVDTYQNSIFTWKDGNTIEVTITPNHSLSNADSVVISGLTSALSQINKLVKIGITSYSSTVSQNIPSNSSVGLVTDIYVSRIPDRISAGASMVIESEVLSVLNIFPYEKIIRAKRTVGSAHTATTTIQFIPNTFTFKADTDYFESKVNDKIFFNPSESVGLGRSVGISTSRVFALGISTVGVATYVRNILTQSIYIENHPFANNQKVILRVPNSSYPLSISTSFSGTAFNIPGSGTYQTVYVTDKSKNTIGIKTTLSSSEVFFVGIGSDSYEYSIESNFDQVNAKVQKIKSTVSVSTAHNLSDGDTVTLTVNPNLSVGIGTSTSILVKYNSPKKKLLINPLQFTSSGINTSQNTITISNHSLNTGDKVFYSSSGLIASGLSTGSYFVYKIDDDSIKLASTYIDCKNDPPTVVSIASSGGNLQSISPINPEIKVIKNNDVVFNLSDSSLSGYKFKIFYDKDFNDEFISTGSTSSFSVTGVGTVGISTNASLTLNYSERLPQTLFYTLEKSGYISTSDKDVSNYSKISFVDSFYNGTYTVSGIGSTTFNIALKQNPEKSSYIPSECNILEYSTSSLTAKGGINKIKKLSTGSNYKKLPVFIGVASSEGSGSYVVAKSNSVGKIKEVRILNPGFEYGSDTTLRPTAYISPIITIESSYNISDVGVAYGGKNYNFAPNLTVINSITRKNINNGSLEAVLSNSSIVSVNIIEPPRGIPSDDVEIISTNNSNGTSVDKVYASGIGIVTCYLTTPILGFSTSPFSVGDKIYVEGIQNSNSGTGYNSENFGYTFFTVTGFQNTIPAKLEYNISGLTTSNPGVAKTVQNSLASIIKYTDYPQFNITKLFSNFKIGEKISSYDGANFVERDLIVTNYNKSTIKVLGSYELSKNETIKGTKSGTFASISNIEYNTGRFDTNYSLRRNFGWNDDIGKLNEDYQVIEDNDYYQNLSYTIKSPIDYETLISPVNRLLHTSGLKNFADTGITSTTNSGIKSSIDGSIQILNLADENRIDTINNFDLCIDTDSFENKTKYIKFKNKKLSDYIKCVSNRVLLIDDISSKFSSTGLESSDQNNLISILPNDEYNRYLIQITDTENTQYEISELIILNNQNNLYTLEKGFINNLGIGTYYESQRIAEVVGYVDENNNQFLRFNPVDIYNKDYNIKILNNKFINDLSGIGTQNLGLINLISSNVIVPTGITSSVVSIQSTTYNSLYFNLHVRDNSTYESNYVEIYLNHDGTNTYLSQYYVDSSSENNLSYGIIGSFGSTLSSGVLSLNFTNTSTNQVTIRSRTVGFGSTSSGISTYRYKLSEQIDGTELTAIYESKYSKNSGISTITSLSKDNFASVKSVVRVSVGNTSALHQVLLVNDGNNLAVKQYPFLSIGSTSGIGTFGGEYSGSNFSLKFYPDQTITGIVDISSYNEEIYKNSDAVNSPPNLSYGQIIESLNAYEYAGINGNRISRTSFELNYQGYPIFKKAFNPKESSTLDLTTGIFTIKNHFYNTGEELSYTPKSSFIGIGETAVGIGSTANYVGVVTNLLPPKVYPIKLSDDTFRLSTRRDYALAGIYVTFTSYGLGNAHELEMSKKLEKSLITIDSLVQYPIAYTTLNYNLNKNGGQIGASSTIFSVSGISSIKPSDIVKIDDEYMLVVNVGFGTTNIGPITGVGTTALLQVTRGFVGSSSTTHTDSTSVKIYRGSYNISGNKIHFTNPPTGDLRAFKNSSNLTPPKSSFDGRVYLRKNYETNQLYDNISSKFTGIGRTYTLTVNGINTVGLGTSGGNGILFINSIFQRPSTSNNTGNNFSIIENAGISSVVFSGISTSSSSSIIVSNDDVNQNQLPRGGLIVSLGSTGGLGYAPLVGASVTAIVSGGSIVSVGLGTTDILGLGYYGSVSIGVTDSTGINASIRATVGAGGTLSFTILNGGSGYTNPTIKIPSPSYENLPVIGVSRLGIGSTTNTGVGLLVNIEVGSSSTTGIGSTLFEVRSFNIQRSGYGFKPGDVVTPVGLVTAKNLPSPISQFQLNVLDTFTDSFAAWQFGELDYIDSIKNLQDSVRVTFPLYYNASLLSFEIDKDDQDSSKIDLNNVLLIFINGVLQKPGDSYTFDGGSIFTFSNPPKSEDQVSIFFYRGSRDSDSILITNPNESIRSGDIVQLKKNNTIPSTINQNLRTVFTILGSDKIETNLYTNQGIDNVNYKPLSWTKQKIDQKINGQILYKSRDSIESEVYPTAKVIRDFSTTDIEIFVDDAYFFNYEENQSSTIIDSIDGLIVSGSPDSISAGATAVVSQSNTQLQYLSIGYSGSYYLTPTITNLHLRSEDFSTGWTLSNAANSSLTANIATSPDNLVTSGSFVCSTTGNATRRLYASTNITTVSGTDYTYSIYLKSLNNWQYVYISLSSVTTVTESGGARFDIINGIVSTISSGSASIINAGNGWWRVSVTTSGNTITTMRPKIILVNSTGTASSSATGVINSGVYVWGSQLEAKMTSSAYVPTGASSKSGSSLSINITPPNLIGVGLGTTATAIGSIVNGFLTKALLTYPGFGYTTSSPPRVLISQPSPTYEKISGITDVKGFSGIVTGIGTTTGTLGNPLAIKFNLNVQSPTSFPSGLTTGYPIYIYNTSVGRGVTSIDGNNTSTVGIGTTFLDNIYKIHSFNYTSLTNAYVICNVLSTTSVVGIATTGTSVGRFSWGRMSGFSRSRSPISIGVTGSIVDVGLSTFPSIQRRGYGLRNTGSLKKDLG